MSFGNLIEVLRDQHCSGRGVDWLLTENCQVENASFSRWQHDSGVHQALDAWFSFEGDNDLRSSNVGFRMETSKTGLLVDKGLGPKYDWTSGPNPLDPVAAIGPVSVGLQLSPGTIGRTGGSIDRPVVGIEVAPYLLDVFESTYDVTIGGVVETRVVAQTARPTGVTVTLALRGLGKFGDRMGGALTLRWTDASKPLRVLVIGLPLVEAMIRYYDSWVGTSADDLLRPQSAGFGCIAQCNTELGSRAVSEQNVTVFGNASIGAFTVASGTTASPATALTLSMIKTPGAAFVVGDDASAEQPGDVKMEIKA